MRNFFPSTTRLTNLCCEISRFRIHGFALCRYRHTCTLLSSPAAMAASMAAVLAPVCHGVWLPLLYGLPDGRVDPQATGLLRTSKTLFDLGVAHAFRA